MDHGRVAQLTRELGDAEVAELLLAARATVVTAVPDEVARRHLRAMTLAAGTAAAGAVSIGTASTAAASSAASTAAAGAAASGSVGTAAVASAGGAAAAGGSALGAVGSLKVAIATAAALAATAGGLGATGHLPDPTQRIVDEVVERLGGPVDGATDLEPGGAGGGGDVRPADGGHRHGDDGSVRSDTDPADRGVRDAEVAPGDTPEDSADGSPVPSRGGGEADGAPIDAPTAVTPTPVPHREDRAPTTDEPPVVDAPDTETDPPSDDPASRGSDDTSSRQEEAPERPDGPGSRTPEEGASGRSASAPGAPEAAPVTTQRATRADAVDPEVDPLVGPAGDQRSAPAGVHGDAAAPEGRSAAPPPPAPPASASHASTDGRPADEQRGRGPAGDPPGSPDPG